MLSKKSYSNGKVVVGGKAAHSLHLGPDGKNGNQKAEDEIRADSEVKVRNKVKLEVDEPHGEEVARRENDLLDHVLGRLIRLLVGWVLTEGMCWSGDYELT